MGYKHTHTQRERETHHSPNVQARSDFEIPICACTFSGLEFRSNSIIYAHAKK